MRPLRSPFVQGLLSRLLAGWLRLCIATTRWRHENLEAAEETWASGGGAIVCFWHSRIALAPACWPLDRAQEPRVLISLSPDGEFIAQAVSRLGFPAIRGSSSKKAALDKAKGGAAAFRDVLRWIRSGGGIAVTPDGPRGPAEEMAEGAALLAKASGAPVLLVGLASKPEIVLDTWDRARVPLPFGRGAIVWDGPIIWEEGADLASVRQEWAARLSAATRRAEQML
ncbi:lysophospholipid acyltransferase family protein [Brevundimonas sp.]|uniref:lysophospholipid acyltransferase family protein n=1 Tax=Brevundimonas sp. TaxID=1871086 RepID=UPI0025E65F34|nr:lysophospholipid acyltransferase family protein [Brevundimonas sp.]